MAKSDIKKSSKPKRSRLAPEERRSQLLDCARDIILDQGFSSLTMEAVATRAEVSNPLIYKYFDSRLALLQELLLREFLRFYGEIKLRLEEAEEMADIIRIAVTANFDEGANGNILSILRSQPDIEVALRRDSKNTRDTHGVGNLLIERFMTEFGATRSHATKMVVFSSGASQSAALHWRVFGGNRERMIKDALRFIHSGIAGFIQSN